MGSALASAAAKTQNRIFIADHLSEKAAALAEKIGGNTADNKTIAAGCDMIFLAVKPQILPLVIEEIKSTLKGRSGATLVSMAAGVSTKTLLSYLGFDFPVIRIMPNTPAAVGEGMILYTARGADEAATDAFCKCMEKAGVLKQLPEELIDAATAVSGSGPAFVYMFIDSLAMGGVKCGLTYDTALSLAVQTVIGSAKMIKEGLGTPEELKVTVCSPAGTTIEGVCALQKNGFENAVTDAVDKTFKRAKELGKK